VHSKIESSEGGRPRQKVGTRGEAHPMEIPEERRSCKKEGMVKSCLVFGYDNGDGHDDTLNSILAVLTPFARRSGGGNPLDQLVTP
jgi:hypothetical protein